MCSDTSEQAENRDHLIAFHQTGHLLTTEQKHFAIHQLKALFLSQEIIGYSNAFDAYSVSDPHPEGRGACLAMQRALKMACLKPDQISYINAHGTSTLKNDVMETKAVKKIFGKKAYEIPMSSTKSMIGHLISAAGAVEMVASIACARVGKIHPTLNVDNPDPECDLDYVAHTSRDHEIETILCNSFAFGGQNATIILRVWQ